MIKLINKRTTEILCRTILQSIEFAFFPFSSEHQNLTYHVHDSGNSRTRGRLPRRWRRLRVFLCPDDAHAGLGWWCASCICGRSLGRFGGTSVSSFPLKERKNNEQQNFLKYSFKICFVVLLHREKKSRWNIGEYVIIIYIFKIEAGCFRDLPLISYWTNFNNSFLFTCVL